MALLWVALGSLGSIPSVDAGRRAPAKTFRAQRAGQSLAALSGSLFSRSMEPALNQLQREIAATGAKTEGFDPPSGVMPRDPFLREIAERLAGQFEVAAHPERVAAAVADVLLEASDKNGNVHTSVVTQRYGARAGRLVRSLLRETNMRQRDAAHEEAALTTYGSERLHDALARWTRVDRPVMRSFDRLVAEHAGTKPLRGFRLIGVQHLIGTTGSLLHALVDSGMIASEMSLLTKPYSQNRRVVNALEKKQFRIQTLSHMMISAVDINKLQAEQMFEHIEHELEIAPPDQKIMVIDDGGKLVRMIHDRLLTSPERIAALAHRFVGIEQTQKGIIELGGMKLLFPVINVAESEAKKIYESPAIGHALGNVVDRKLTKLRDAGATKGKKVVVLGFGAIGSSTARSLMARGYEVEIYDSDLDADKTALAHREGFTIHASLEDALRNGNIVVSATGKTPIHTGNANLLPDGAVLFNVASGDTEIDRKLKEWTHRDGLTITPNGAMHAAFQGATIELGDQFNAGRSDRVIRLPSGKQLLLASNGYVMNFTGVVNPTPPRYIQLTRGLLYLAALQAARATEPGLQALAKEPQDALVSEIQRELAETGESMLTPSF